MKNGKNEVVNKQINIRLPKKLLDEGYGVAKDHNFKNIQHLIIEGLRKIILEHNVKREVEAIKQFQDIHAPSPSDVPVMNDMAQKYGLRKFR